MLLKPSLHIRFPHAFSALCCDFLLHTFIEQMHISVTEIWRASQLDNAAWFQAWANILQLYS